MENPRTESSYIEYMCREVIWLQAQKSVAPAASTGSNMSTARSSDKKCHTCGGRGHFKKDCPNSKVMVINDEGQFESGDDADPNGSDDDGYASEEGEDAFPVHAPTIVVSQRALSVQPNIDSQRCNLFQTKALVGPNKACKVIIDGVVVAIWQARNCVPSSN